MPKFDPKAIKLDSIHVMKWKIAIKDGMSHRTSFELGLWQHSCILSHYVYWAWTIVGKTNTIVNVFLQHQTTCDPFKQLIIIGPTNGASEYSEMEPTFILYDIPPLESFAGKKIKKLLFDDLI